MNNFKKITAAALAISFSFLGASVIGESNVSFASENKTAPKVNLDIQPSNVPYQESVVTLNQNDATRQAVLNQLRDVRSKAWDENLKLQWDDDGSTRKIRDIYNDFTGNYNNKEGYVNAYGYSLELERLALQRAYELSLTGSIQERPDGTRYETLNYKGLQLGLHSWVYDDYENDLTPKKLFDTLLYNKDVEGGNGYKRFIESNGSYETTGSVYNMLMFHPTFMGVGYGQVKNPETGKTFAVIAYDLDPFFFNDGPEKVDYVGDYTMSFGNPNFKKASKETLDKLEVSVKEAKRTIAGAEILTNSMPNFGEKYGYELGRLIENQKAIISKAEAFLRANGR